MDWVTPVESTPGRESCLHYEVSVSDVFASTDCGTFDAAGHSMSRGSFALVYTEVVVKTYFHNEWAPSVLHRGVTPV